MAKKKEPLFVIDPGSEIKASGNGYKYVTTTPDHPFGEKGRSHDHAKKYVYLHRALCEIKLHRYLDPKIWEVHHKDLDHSNNAPSNLEAKKKGEHQRDHAHNDNHFWKKSPRTKKRKASAYRVASQFLSDSIRDLN